MDNDTNTKYTMGTMKRMRVELGTILMKFAFEISVQLWSSRDSSGVPPL